MEDTDWGHFVDLDTIEKDLYLFQKNKYNKYKFYSPLKKIEEIKEQDLVKEDEIIHLNEEKITIMMIPIPFLKKRMKIQVKNTSLLIHFTLTIVSMSLVTFIFYL